MISSANALKWSMWLAATHPAAFKAVLQRLPRASAPARTGLGAVQGTYIPRAHLNASSRGTRRARGPVRMGNAGPQGHAGPQGLGYFGQDDGLSPDVVTVESPTPDISTSTADIASDPTLQDINVSVGDLSSNVDSSTLASAAAATDTSGGFWSSLGSGLASVGSGLASAVGSVAGAVTNPQTLAAAGNIAASVIKANATNAQSAALQQAVLQSQLQRTATGTGAAPIRYGVNPATGQTVPYYYNARTGQYQLSQPSLLSAFAPTGTGLSQYLPYILIGGGILITVALLRR